MSKLIFPSMFIAEIIKEFFSRIRFYYSVLAFIPFAFGLHGATLVMQGRSVLAWLLFGIAVGLFIYGILSRFLHRFSWMWLLFLVLGFALCRREQDKIAQNDYKAFFSSKDEVQLDGVVGTEPYFKGRYWVFDLEKVCINGKPAKGDVLLKLVPDSSGAAYCYGDHIEVTGRLQELPEARNPGEFNYAEYLGNHGIYAVVTVFSPEKIKRLAQHCGSPIMMHLILPIRNFIRDVVDKAMGKQGYLILGILLGDKRQLPDEVMHDFRLTGLMHLLAVSGLNVGMLMLIFYIIFGAFRIPYSIRLLLTIAVVWLYAGVTDLSPSVVRAAVMGSIIMLGWMLERKAFIFNSLAFSALVILMVNPLYLYDIGFQLSYLATWAIIYLYPKLRSLVQWKPDNFLLKGISDSLILSLSAMLGTLPLIAYSFNNVAPISLVANLVAVPLSFALLGLGLAMVFLGFIPVAASAFGTSAYWLTVLLNKCVSLFAKVPGGYLPMASPTLVWILIYFSMLIFAVNFKEKRWARKGAFFFLALAFCLGEAYALIKEQPIVTLSFFDVGQGDCALVELPGKEAYLIDGGPKDQYVDAGTRVILPYFLRNGIDSLSGVFVTHAHNDHLGGMLSVLEQEPVGQAFETGLGALGSDYENLVKVLTNHATPRQVLQAGDRVTINQQVSLDVLHPMAQDSMLSLNETSMVLRMKAGKYSILFMGDLGGEGERLLLNRLDTIKADLIKIGHHGSMTSTSDALLVKSRPEAAIISVGRYNRFGHPHPDLLARLKNHHVRYFRTDLSGAVLVRIYSDRYEINTQLK